MSCVALNTATMKQMAEIAEMLNSGDVREKAARASSSATWVRSDPRAAPSQADRIKAVEQGRPEKLEGVGQAHQREHADGGEVDAFGTQPCRHHLVQHIEVDRSGKPSPMQMAMRL